MVCRRSLLAASCVFLGSLGQSTAVPAADGAAPEQPARMVSVTDFGARGDGVTDDWPAFQAAVDSLRVGEATGGILLVPPASRPYLLSRTLVVGGVHGLTLVGYGAALDARGPYAIATIREDEPSFWQLPGTPLVGSYDIGATRIELAEGADGGPRPLRGQIVIIRCGGLVPVRGRRPRSPRSTWSQPSRVGR